jgi:hypothetical protein
MTTQESSGIGGVLFILLLLFLASDVNSWSGKTIYSFFYAMKIRCSVG